MINAIGAFIFTIILLGFREAKLDTARIEQRLASASLILHAAIVLLLCWIGWYTVEASRTQQFAGWIVFLVEAANLWIHEAGHGYCMFFPEAVMVLGGTLLQLAVPSILAIYMALNRRYLLACLLAFWLAQNLPSIASYISDARAQKLELLGGGDSTHDWAFMLGRLNLLEFDTQIGSVVNALGVCGMLAAIGGYLWFVIRPTPVSPIADPLAESKLHS